MEVADAIESSISSDTLAEFKADPRSTKAINNALSRAFHKSIKELSPVKEAQQKANRAEELWRKHTFSEPYDIYLALSGEVEARNVQTRMDMTAEERRRKSPQSTEDVSREHQIPVLPDNVGVWRVKSYSLNEDPNSEFAKAVITPKRSASNFKEAREQAKAFQGKQLIIHRQTSVTNNRS